MADRILNSAWWLTLMSMICLGAGFGLYLEFRGLFDLLSGNWVTGAVRMAIGAGAAAAAIVLCRLRDDLMYAGRRLPRL